MSNGMRATGSDLRKRSTLGGKKKRSKRRRTRKAGTTRRKRRRTSCENRKLLVVACSAGEEGGGAAECLEQHVATTTAIGDDEVLEVKVAWIGKGVGEKISNSRKLKKISIGLFLSTVLTIRFPPSELEKNNFLLASSMSKKLDSEPLLERCSFVTA